MRIVLVLCLAGLTAGALSRETAMAEKPAKLPDLRTEDVTAGNLRLRLLRADDASFAVAFGRPLGPYFRLVLRVENVHAARKVEFRSLCASASLCDEHDNDYARIRWPREAAILVDDAKGRKDRAFLGPVTIYPGKSVEDILLFQLPVKAAKKLVLTVPYRLKATGEKVHKLRVQVPRAKR